MEIFNKIIAFIKEQFDKLNDEQKRRFFLVCAAVVSLLLTFSVIMSFKGTGSGSREKKKAEPERVKIISPIPAAEIFLPDEPDFIPGVLLERDRRSSWTEDDASEYWQDPLKFGEEQWREKIETAVDEFLERIP